MRSVTKNIFCFLKFADGFNSVTFVETSYIVKQCYFEVILL